MLRTSKLFSRDAMGLRFSKLWVRGWYCVFLCEGLFDGFFDDGEGVVGDGDELSVEEL